MKQHLELMGFEVLSERNGTFLISHSLIGEEIYRVSQTINGLILAHRWLIFSTDDSAIGRPSAICRSRASLAVAVEAA